MLFFSRWTRTSNHRNWNSALWHPELSADSSVNVIINYPSYDFRIFTIKTRLLFCLFCCCFIVYWIFKREKKNKKHGDGWDVNPQPCAPQPGVFQPEPTVVMVMITAMLLLWCLLWRFKRKEKKLGVCRALNLQPDTPQAGFLKPEPTILMMRRRGLVFLSFSLSLWL